MSVRVGINVLKRVLSLF